MFFFLKKSLLNEITNSSIVVQRSNDTKNACCPQGEKTVQQKRIRDPALLFLPKMSFRYKGSWWVGESFALNDDETPSNKKSTKKLWE